MSNLLKEAIADAKTVRETAIANAKMALEEAFTPHLKSMLSAKLAEDEVEEGFEDEITAEEMDDEEDEDMEEMMHDKNRREDDDEDMDEGEHDDEQRREDDDEDMDEGIIEINGVKYAPITEEDDDEDPEEGARPKREDDDEMDEDIDNLDLEAVIKELETEIAEAEESDEDSVNEGEHEDDEKDEVDEEIVVEEDEDDEDKVDEQSKSSGIGAGDNKVNKASAGDEEDPGKGKEMKESVNAMQKELNEYKEAVTFLREKLHEVNILNAKLLYTNRLFKEFVLSNDQKMKIVETFDRAQTSREIKLVYSTLAESFKNGDIKKNRVQESASQKTGTTKPTKKIITEESEVANRFKKLAGIL